MVGVLPPFDMNKIKLKMTPNKDFTTWMIKGGWQQKYLNTYCWWTNGVIGCLQDDNDPNSNWVNSSNDFDTHYIWEQLIGNEEPLIEREW